MKPAAQWAREDGLYVADNELFRKFILGAQKTEGTAESPLRPTHKRSLKVSRVRVHGNAVHERGT